MCHILHVMNINVVCSYVCTYVHTVVSYANLVYKTYIHLHRYIRSVKSVKTCVLTCRTGNLRVVMVAEIAYCVTKHSIKHYYHVHFSVYILVLSLNNNFCMFVNNVLPYAY